MPPSTIRPGNRSRSTPTLPTPFCRTTMTASCGACLAMMPAISAVSALLTVTSTTPASLKIEGFSDSVSWSAAILRSRPSKLVSRSPSAFDLGDHARPRQQGDLAAGRRQHAADEAADAAGPGDANRSLYRHASLPSVSPRSIADFCRRCPSPPRGRLRPRLVTVMARRYLCAGGWHAAGDDNGFTRHTQRHAERPARPQQSERAKTRAACRR